MISDTVQIDSTRRGAIWITSKLNEAGFEAYLVGGCVRDRLMGRPIGDYDIATSAKPDEVQKIFRRTIAVGAQFGVIIVVTREGEYEVATFRADAAYSDGRRPDSIKFTNAREDVLRRDFTINGLLENPETGEICDFVDGKRDLDARIIRAIGDPHARFAEDHLRVLRAIRFAAVLGFDIESNTFNAIIEMAPMVAQVSVERIHKELSRAFTEGDPARAYTLLALSGVLDAVLPEADWLGSNVAAKLHALGRVPFAVTLAALLGHAPPKDGIAVAERLKTSKQERDLLAYLLKGRSAVLKLDTHADTVRFIRHPDWSHLAALLLAEAASRGKPTDPIDALVALQQSLTEEQLNPPRLLDGQDLKAMGLKPGPQFKQLLHDLESAQLEARVTTRDEAEAFIRAASSP